MGWPIKENCWPDLSPRNRSPLVHAQQRTFGIALFRSLHHVWLWRSGGDGSFVQHSMKWGKPVRSFLRYLAGSWCLQEKRHGLDPFTLYPTETHLPYFYGRLFSSSFLRTLRMGLEKEKVKLIKTVMPIVPCKWAKDHHSCCVTADFLHLVRSLRSQNEQTCSWWYQCTPSAELDRKMESHSHR